MVSIDGSPSGTNVSFRLESTPLYLMSLRPQLAIRKLQKRTFMCDWKRGDSNVVSAAERCRYPNQAFTLLS